MPDLRQTRKQLKIALAIMAGIDIVAALVYFSPLVGSAESRRQQMDSLQSDLKIKTAQVAPLKDLPNKVDIASRQISVFYKTRFPTENSQIASELGKIAAANGVNIEEGKWKLADQEEDQLQPLEMEYNLSGSYTSLAKFINAVERDDMFFIINSVTLGGEPHGVVRLDVKLETYLKAGTT